MASKVKRLREIDFLRGIAIILVLFRHKPLFDFTVNMGWIGVDLFFVLSGFLVSGLLFNEYIKYGNINATRFLIRRGFKIYPIYYLTYVFYLIPKFLEHNVSVKGILADGVFLQNYLFGWGYAYPASWSLAVEEHFYFGLAFCLWLGLKNKVANGEERLKAPFKQFETIVFLIFLTCLALRVVSNWLHPEREISNFTMTHLRIDSLMMGVLVSYLYYFKRTYLTHLYEKYKPVLPFIFLLGVCWAPFFDPFPSFFVKTIGFSLLFLSFGVLLVSFLLNKNINEKLDALFSVPVVNFVSKIGYCSYSIYVIHTLMIHLESFLVTKYHLYTNPYLSFILATSLCIAVGMFMTFTVETFFLNIRDKYFPSRTLKNS
jgi:peptidoglycan/LPS O-acetylase OafA/YrhL